MKNGASKVEDLKEKILRGELNPKQAKKILHERGAQVQFHFGSVEIMEKE